MTMCNVKVVTPSGKLTTESHPTQQSPSALWSVLAYFGTLFCFLTFGCKFTLSALINNMFGCFWLIDLPKKNS